MRSRSALVALALAAAACRTANPAPPHWSPTPEQAAKRVLGHWIVVERADGPPISGELIAVGIYGQERDAGTIYVGLDDQLVAIRAQHVKKIRLVEYTPSSEGATAWTWLGVLTTPSHGGFLIFSLPGWLVFGGVAATVQESKGVGEYSAKQWPLRRDSVRKFARFPQGLPAQLVQTAREATAR